MGLYIVRRARKKADFLKLKWLLQNFAARRVLEELVRPDERGPQRVYPHAGIPRLVAESVLEGLARGENDFPLSYLARRTIAKVLSLSGQALALSEEETRQALAKPSVKRTIVNGLLSLHRFGLRFPMRFWAPLMVVWNFTYRCNLRCKHCYEDAGPLRSSDFGLEEMSLERKLAAVEEIAASYIPTLSFSGGEPLIHPHFWPVAERAHELGLYLSVNTNGTLISEKVAKRLEELDFAYVSVSIDSPAAEEHDRFRGQPGAWERAVRGLRNMQATNVDTVLGFTITRYNHHRLKETFRFGESLGIDKVMIYNFIPTGRGKEMIEGDLPPEAREEALQQMYEYSASGGSLCTTAPQLGRVCQEMGRPDLIPLAHTGSGEGGDMKLLADLIGGCGAARAYCALQPDGRVTPCVYMPDVTVGHIDEQSLLSIWQNASQMNFIASREGLKGHCRECEYRAVCGGCRARAWAYFQDLKAPDPGCIRNAHYFLASLPARRAHSPASAESIAAG